MQVFSQSQIKVGNLFFHNRSTLTLDKVLDNNLNIDLLSIYTVDLKPICKEISS